MSGLPSDDEIKEAFIKKLREHHLGHSQQSRIVYDWSDCVYEDSIYINSSFNKYNHKLLVKIGVHVLDDFRNQRSAILKGNIECNQQLPALIDSLFVKLIQRFPELLAGSL